MGMNKIACCTDFSENGKIAVGMAIELAEKYQASLHVVHVLPPQVNPFGVEVDLSELADEGLGEIEEVKMSLAAKVEEQIAENWGERIADRFDYEIVVLNGHVSSEILRYVQEEKIDCVVVGAYGLSGMGLVLFGSVAKRVAHKAPCSVLIARKAE